MRAVLYDRYGGPDALTLREIPAPTPGTGELVVRIAAASVNPIDWKFLAGGFRLLTGRRFPRQMGADFAGIVEAVGPGVTGASIGDEVFGSIVMTRGDRGSLAERALVKAGEWARKPAGTSFAEAAALPIVGTAAIYCVDTLGHGQAGQRLLVIGASGGVGSAVVQLAKARGLHVTAVCSEKNRDFVRALGADDVSAYDREDIFASGQRFDVIVDAVGAHSFRRCAPLLTRRGAYISTIPSPRLFLEMVYARLATRQRAYPLMARVKETHLHQLATLVESGQLRPVVMRTFPLDEVREAVELSMSGRARGKVVVIPAA